MPIEVSLVPPEETVRLRDLDRDEMKCQIVLDSWHGRGWTDLYLLWVDGRVAGYGLVGGVRAESNAMIPARRARPSVLSRTSPRCSLATWLSFDTKVRTSPGSPRGAQPVSPAIVDGRVLHEVQPR